MQRTFVEARILSGFMDDAHFRGFSGEYLASLDSASQTKLLEEAQRSRNAVAGLPSVSLGDAIVRPLTGARVEAIVADPTFQAVFRARPYQFAWIRPDRIVALQVYVEPRADPIPPNETELLEFALPSRWDVPAEIAFTPPLGPIYIVSSSPHMQGFTAELDSQAGKVTIQPPKHINLIQVMHYGDRYYLRNGYHRLFDAINSGASEIPAVIVEALQPQDLTLRGSGFFDVGYVLGLARPPLVADFTGPAAILGKVRERRYGVSITLQVSPFSIGV